MTPPATSTRSAAAGAYPGLTDRVALALADLDDARKPSDLDLPGYRFHPLKGNLLRQWRCDDVDLVDYH